MAKRRVKKYIKRTYYVTNPKTGRKNKVTKIYYKSQISPVLTYASGKINEDRIDEFLETINPMDRQDARDLLRRAQYNKVRMTEKTLRAKLASSKREMMVINTGETMKNTLKQLHATEEEFMDDRRWKKGGIFVNAKGESYQFRFNYRGNIWKKLST